MPMSLSFIPIRIRGEASRAAAAKHQNSGAVLLFGKSLRK